MIQATDFTAANGRFNFMSCSVETEADTRSDYAIELARIDESMDDLRPDTRSIESTTRFLYALYRRGSLTNNFLDFEIVEREIDSALATVGPWPDLCFLKASLDLKFHRLARVKEDLALAPALAASTSGKVLQADVDFQEGRYEAAKVGLENAIKVNRSWDSLARLAYFNCKIGDERLAEQLYFEAEEEITVKELRAFAWVELQRGLIDLSHGRYEEASLHYARADETYTGYWLVKEHVAELLGAEGKFEEAISSYEQIVTEVSKPELKQVIGELYLVMGRSREAQPWLDAALSDYLFSVDQGHVHYYHHLTDFYSEVRDDRKEAIRWARRDHELRPNFGTKSALAWALFRDDQVGEAFDLINQSLVSGAQDARLFYKAGMIYLAAGRLKESQTLTARAAQMNPRYEDFHVHH